MLILTRKKGQSIMIGSDIEIVISAVEGDQVKIGISAPSNVVVLRKEVFDEVRQNNREAVRGKLDIARLRDLAKADSRGERFD